MSLSLSMDARSARCRKSFVMAVRALCSYCFNSFLYRKWFSRLAARKRVGRTAVLEHIFAVRDGCTDCLKMLGVVVLRPVGHTVDYEGISHSGAPWFMQAEARLVSEPPTP